jgi:uncharacterized repeat protein (TIGR03803 family)
MGRDGTLYTLHSFSGSSGDGYYPYNALLQGTDGCLYGTTWGGGDYQIGVIFRMTPSGNLITLYSFHADYALPLGDGAQPHAGLVQSADGYFYGTATGGGAFGIGTFFRFPIPPTLEIAAQTNSSLALKWCAVVGAVYQLQYTTDMDSTNWIDLDAEITATNIIATQYDIAPCDVQRFYRVLLLQ